MRGDLGAISRNQQLADVRGQLRRLRVPPQTKNYTRLGALSVESPGAIPLHNDTGRVLSVSSVRVMVGSAPSTQPVIVDVQIGGASIFASSTFPAVPVGQTVGDPAAPDDNQWMPGDALYVNLSQGDDSANDLHVAIVVG